MATSAVRLTVNGAEHTIQAEHHWTLLRVLREQLALTGTKNGCDRGECGACTVLLDGKAVYSCQVLAALADGGSIVTVEGLGDPEGMHPLQAAFVENDGGQCGFCTPGFLMSAAALLQVTPRPTEEDVRRGLSGNICRCNAYGRIIQSVLAGARALRGESDGD